MLTNIYTDKILKYPLTQEEYKKVDDVWTFIKIFNKPFLYISDYRDYLIKKIDKKYNFKEFFLYESIMNKMFWNLRWLLFPLFLNHKLDREKYYEFIENNYDDHQEIPNTLIKCNELKYTDQIDLDNKLKEISLILNNYYRSFINKLIIIDNNNKIIYYKQMEGSSDIFHKNLFNLYTMTVLFNRKLYEKIMKDPYLIKREKIPLSNYYLQYDYGLPNLNYCTYNFSDKETRINRIKKMYYNIDHDAEYFYKLIV
jgi:hypothetical protein